MRVGVLTSGWKYITKQHHTWVRLQRQVPVKSQTNNRENHHQRLLIGTARHELHVESIQYMCVCLSVAAQGRFSLVVGAYHPQ